MPRQHRSDQLLVLLNFSVGQRTVTVPDGTPGGEFLFSATSIESMAQAMDTFDWARLRAW